MFLNLLENHEFIDEFHFKLVQIRRSVLKAVILVKLLNFYNFQKSSSKTTQIQKI